MAWAWKRGILKVCKGLRVFHCFSTCCTSYLFSPLRSPGSCCARQGMTLEAEFNAVVQSMHPVEDWWHNKNTQKQTQQRPVCNSHCSHNNLMIYDQLINNYICNHLSSFIIIYMTYIIYWYYHKGLTVRIWKNKRTQIEYANFVRQSVF